MKFIFQFFTIDILFNIDIAKCFLLQANVAQCDHLCFLQEQHRFLTICLLSIELCKDELLMPRNQRSPFSFDVKPIFRKIRVSE